MSQANRTISDSTTARSPQLTLQKIVTVILGIGALVSFSSTRADNVDGAWSTLIQRSEQEAMTGGLPVFWRA